MIYIVTKAKTMTELRHAYVIRNRIHVFVMVGGTLLVVTGLWMGFLNTHLFTQGWYIISLILFLIALFAGPQVLAPKSKPIFALLQQPLVEKIPDEYYLFAKQFFFCDRLTTVVFLIIISLMSTKPF